MKERTLKEWEKKIKVLFEHAPQLAKLINNPVYYSNAPWAGKVYSHFLKSTEGSSGEVFFRVVFKQGSPKSLMTIGSGELSGKKTTSVIEKGRITAVAGLEPVDLPTASNLPLLKFEWVRWRDGSIPRQGVKGGRSPAKRTLDALDRDVR